MFINTLNYIHLQLKQASRYDISMSFAVPVYLQNRHELFKENAKRSCTYEILLQHYLFHPALPFQINNWLLFSLSWSCCETMNQTICNNENEKHQDRIRLYTQDDFGFLAVRDCKIRSFHTHWWVIRLEHKYFFEDET